MLLLYYKKNNAGRSNCMLEVALKLKKKKKSSRMRPPEGIIAHTHCYAIPGTYTVDVPGVIL